MQAEVFSTEIAADTAAEIHQAPVMDFLNLDEDELADLHEELGEELREIRAART